MFAKVLCIATMLSIARAGLLVNPLPQAISSQNFVRHNVAKFLAPIAQAVVSQVVPHHVAFMAPAAPIIHHAHPKYQFQYRVSDPYTGDNKFQQESRNGDFVKGIYSFLEADGFIRTVQYTADSINGFNAVVHRSPPAPFAVSGLIKAIPAVNALPIYHR